MVRNFDRARLSPGGFLVLVEDRDLVLPDGTQVVNGEDFRNRFHLLPQFRADLFVPCGGRPRSVNIGNWRQMLDAEGRPRFRVIVEGANLFITQDARLRLEESGVIVIKDASANKGGVTSSSLEVLASLALTDDEYTSWMAVADAGEPEFRKAYVADIVATIRSNARLELQALQRENRKTGKPRSIASDELSRKINQLADALRQSPLSEDPRLVRSVLAQYCPKVLVDTLGLATILERVPAAYVKAIVAKWLAARYVCEHGLGAAEVEFYTFIDRVRERPC
jgi:glutamate dehydrogenase